MRDHDHYEELCALAAGGHLSSEERDELNAHLADCADCRRNAQDYRYLVSAALPLTRNAANTAGERVTASPSAGVRERFIARARREGIQFSSEVEARDSARWWPLPYRVAAGVAFAAMLIAAASYLPDFLRRFAAGQAAQQEIDRLTRENSQLGERLVARERELAGHEEQLRALRNQLAAAATATGASAPATAAPGLQLGQSTSREARLLEELKNRDAQLAAAAEEIGRINQLSVTDRATLDAQSTRLRQMFDELRIATATVDMERQLAAAGRDLLTLMSAKELRVIDVRDTDANGRASAAFARVFIAEGTTIRIFAFDLNDGDGAAARRFQVWGEQLGSKDVRRLGVLDVDDRTQNRWTLTIQNADMVKGINAVFVTTATGNGAADGLRMLYAFLG